MKKIYFLLIIGSVFSLQGMSQTSVSRIFIQGGRNAWENYMKEIYEYPSFQKGIVEFRDGKRYTSNLNYNLVLGTIQFIDDKGDTLALSNEATISSVNIGANIYYYTPSCLRQVSGNDRIKFARNERIRIADKQKVGALGIANSTASIDSYERTETSQRNRFDINEELLLRKTTTYYFGNADNLFVIASKKSVLHLFPKYETSIKQYLKDNSTDFTKEEDLQKLTAYLGEL